MPPASSIRIIMDVPDLGSPETMLIALRAIVVSLARHGKPDSERLAAIHRKVAALYPTPYSPVNQFACELLVYLDNPQVVAKTMTLLAAAPTHIVIAVGEESLDTFTGRTAVATAELLGQEATVFPSHHGGFMGGEFGYAGQPEAFARRLREVLDQH